MGSLPPPPCCAAATAAAAACCQHLVLARPSHSAAIILLGWCHASVSAWRARAGPGALPLAQQVRCWGRVLGAVQAPCSPCRQPLLPATAAAAAAHQQGTACLASACPACRHSQAPMPAPADAGPEPASMAIPLIDLSPLRQSPLEAAAVRALAAQVDRACRDVGFLCEPDCACFLPFNSTHRPTDSRGMRRAPEEGLREVRPCWHSRRAHGPVPHNLVRPRRACPPLPCAAADIAGHGMPEGEMQARLGLARRLFDLPQAAKTGLDASQSPLARGWVGPGGRQRHAAAA